MRLTFYHLLFTITMLFLVISTRAPEFHYLYTEIWVFSFEKLSSFLCLRTFPISIQPFLWEASQVTSRLVLSFDKSFSGFLKQNRQHILLDNNEENKVGLFSCLRFQPTLEIHLGAKYENLIGSLVV